MNSQHPTGNTKLLHPKVPADLTMISTRYSMVCRAALGFLLLLVGVTLLLPRFVPYPVIEPLSFWFSMRQDLPLAGLFLLLALVQPSLRPHTATAQANGAKAALVVSSIVILLVGWIGSKLVFHGYLLSRDEQMAVFDQQIFAQGRLMWPISSEWRAYADALNKVFLLPIRGNQFWVSAYLPVHSAFRGLMAEIGVVELSSPLMAATSAVALWFVERRLWPDSDRTVVVGLLLLTTSSQLLITSMTAYSMSMHLALNLVWLALFLTNRPQTHALAILVGFLATGIHQPLFHPLFVLPFLLLLVSQRRGRLLAVYAAAYAAIGAFWLAWPHWMASQGAIAALGSCGSSGCEQSVGYGDRLLGIITAFDLKHLWLTAANLLRFVCWQHPLLVPLAFFGTISCWRSEPLVRVLALGFVLPIVLIAIILPYQGHGWGYRYLEPVLGNAILLGCYGFRTIERNGLSMQRPLVITTAAALVLIPVHAWMAERFAAPFASVHKDIVATPADVVIVDAELVPFGQDLVLNRPDLSNRPILMIASKLGDEGLLALCKRQRITFYDPRKLAPIADLFGTPVPKSPSRYVANLQRLASSGNCKTARPRSTRTLVTTS